MLGPHDLAFVSHLSPNTRWRSDCFGPNDFALVFHLLHDGFSARMISGLSPTCLPLKHLSTQAGRCRMPSRCAAAAPLLRALAWHLPAADLGADYACPTWTTSSWQSLAERNPGPNSARDYMLVVTHLFWWLFQCSTCPRCEGWHCLNCAGTGRLASNVPAHHPIDVLYTGLHLMGVHGPRINGSQRQLSMLRLLYPDNLLLNFALLAAVGRRYHRNYGLSLNSI